MPMSDRTPKPSNYYTRADGTKQTYEAYTDIPCPVCNPFGAEPNRVLATPTRPSELNITTQVECINCAYTKPMPTTEVLKHLT